jgi:alpha-D-ribose 1-methylphosphonate 5-triphosphate synthase subunit PhnH
MSDIDTIGRRKVGAASAASAAERSARMFRSVLQALARPAAPRPLPAVEPPPAADPALSPAAFAVLSLLADADAPWWLASDRRAAETERRLAFVTSAPMAASPDRAAFLCGGWAALAAEALPHAAIGDSDYPDRGATLLVEVDGFGEGTEATLAGPGLKAPRTLAVAGVDEAFWRFVAANRQRYPLGVDLILCAGDRVVGLPRSLSVIV